MEIELLVGSLTKKQKEKVLERVKNKEIDILIGTHALIEDKVEFNNGVIEYFKNFQSTFMGLS